MVYFIHGKCNWRKRIRIRITYGSKHSCLHACMYTCTYIRTYVPTYMHTHVRTYKCMHICTHVYMYFYVCIHIYICRGELYACDKVINGLLFMLFNAYIIINVSYCWLRSQIIILWLKGRDRWHCICYKDICVKRYNQPPVVIRGGGYLIMINLVLVVCFQSVIHIFLFLCDKEIINQYMSGSVLLISRK